MLFPDLATICILDDLCTQHTDLELVVVRLRTMQMPYVATNF